MQKAVQALGRHRGSPSVGRAGPGAGPPR
jgi:hypothetical protein